MPDILILGASSDIASACAHKFASHGYTIWLAGRNTDLLKTQASDISIRHNAKANVLFFDADKTADHTEFVSTLAFVPDVVLVAFGYLGDQELAEASWDESTRIINTNYVGAVSILNALTNVMRRQKKGVIVGISSVAGSRGRKSNYIYGSAKAGLTAYLSGLRNKLYNDNIHVVTVLPGFVYTKMTEHLQLPKPLTAKPETVADAIYSAVKNKKNVVYVKPVWRLIMFTISNIPEFIYKKLSIG
jgi:prepilin-type processing-associated H-X9-DG protein